jgi:hypothetical protein
VRTTQPFVAGCTFTRGPVHAVLTGAVHARARVTFIVVRCAEFTAETGLTLALETGGIVHADAVVLTRVLLRTRRGIVGAGRPGEPIGTSARKVIGQVCTNAAVVTRRRGALVDIDLAVDTFEAAWTLAEVVSVDDRADTAVLTRVGVTKRGRLRAGGPGEAVRTLAAEPVDCVRTAAVVRTGRSGTIVHVGFAVQTVVARGALALEPV